MCCSLETKLNLTSMIVTRKTVNSSLKTCISTFVKNTEDTEHKQVNAIGANSRKLNEIEKHLTDLVYFLDTGGILLIAHLLLLKMLRKLKAIDEALNWVDSMQWSKATQSEFDSLMQIQTWDLLDLPDRKNSVGCKWVFKHKRDVDRQIQ